MELANVPEIFSIIQNIHKYCNYFKNRFDKISDRISKKIVKNILDNNKSTSSVKINGPEKYVLT